MPKAVKEAMSKTAILAACAEETGFTKKECGQVLDALSGTIESCIMKVRAPQNPRPTLKRARSLGTPGGARKNACTKMPARPLPSARDDAGTPELAEIAEKFPWRL